jgi:hypothetical protein
VAGLHREPIVDRVTFNARILETGTTSYRLRTSNDLQQTEERQPTAVRPPIVAKAVASVGQVHRALPSLTAAVSGCVSG